MDERISNSEALTGIFGRWPSFHDAEVLAVRLERGEGASGPSLEADIHVWEMSGEVDAQGFYVQRDHTLATLRFDGIDELDLGGFNHQNVLSELTLEDRSERGRDMRWGVALRASFGLDARFVCAQIAVAAVRPYQPL